MPEREKDMDPLLLLNDEFNRKAVESPTSPKPADTVFTLALVLPLLYNNFIYLFMQMYVRPFWEAFREMLASFA